MKKNKLPVLVDYDFRLLGITSSMKEYKLAWAINEVVDLNFIKSDDIKIDFIDLKNITISNFRFETEHTIFRLLKNRLVFNNALCDQYLIPELKSLDYFIKIEGHEEEGQTDKLVSQIRTIDNIQYITTIDPLNLKQKENLIF